MIFFCAFGCSVCSKCQHIRSIKSSKVNGKRSCTLFQGWKHPLATTMKLYVNVLASFVHICRYIDCISIRMHKYTNCSMIYMYYVNVKCETALLLPNWCFHRSWIGCHKPLLGRLFPPDAFRLAKEAQSRSMVCFNTKHICIYAPFLWSLLLCIVHGQQALTVKSFPAFWKLVVWGCMSFRWGEALTNFAWNFMGCWISCKTDRANLLIFHDFPRNELCL